MSNEIIIAIAFIPIVIISYGIGWHSGFEEASKALKEAYKLFLKNREDGKDEKTE